MVDGDGYGHDPLGYRSFVVIGVSDGTAFGDGIRVDAVVSGSGDEDRFEGIGGCAHLFGEVGTDVDVCADECVGWRFVVEVFDEDPFDGYGYGEGRDVRFRVGAAVCYYAEFLGHGYDPLCLRHFPRERGQPRSPPPRASPAVSLRLPASPYALRRGRWDQKAGLPEDQFQLSGGQTFRPLRAPMLPAMEASRRSSSYQSATVSRHCLMWGVATW